MKIHHAATTATGIEWLLCRTRWSSLWKRYIRPRSRELRQCCCCCWWWWWYSCLGTWWRSRRGSAWRERSWCQQRHRCPGGWGTDWWTSKEAEIHEYWQFSDSSRVIPQKFKWKNWAAGKMMCATQRPFVQNPNPKHTGRRSLTDLPTVSRPIDPKQLWYCRWTLEVDGHWWSSPISFWFYKHQNQQTLWAYAHITHKNWQKKQYKLSSVVQIKALFGVFYMWGALRKNMMVITTVFYHKTADLLFSLAFERKRLSFLCTIIQFDNSRLKME